jgi:hypothetical protein
MLIDAYLWMNIVDVASSSQDRTEEAIDVLVIVASL